MDNPDVYRRLFVMWKVSAAAYVSSILALNAFWIWTCAKRGAFSRPQNALRLEEVTAVVAVPILPFVLAWIP